MEIEVEESRTDYRVLRQDLICSMLKTLSENTNADYPQKLFEIGKVFTPDSEEETGIKEKDSLCIALCPRNFTEMRQILEYLERMLQIELKIEPYTEPLFIEGRTAKISLKDKEIGIFGEIHPSFLKSYHIKLPLALLELDLSSIIS